MFDLDILNFEVEKCKLFHGTAYSVPSDVGVGIRRKDTKQMLGIVSDKYEIVQYSDMAEQISEAITKSGIDLTEIDTQTILSEDSRKLELIVRFPALARSIDGKGDIIAPELKVRKSQDGTWANNGMMGYHRWACYNTLVDGNKLAWIYGKHTKNFSMPAFAAKIGAAAKYISGDGFKKMEKWYTTTVSRDDAIGLFSKTLAKRTDNVSRNNKPNKVMLSNLMKTFDEENRHILGRGLYEKYATRDNGTLWTAYQAATAWSTHTKNMNVKPIREAKVIKMLDSSDWKELELAA